MSCEDKRYNFNLSLYPEDCSGSDFVNFVRHSISIIDLCSAKINKEAPKENPQTRKKLCKCRKCDPASFNKCLKILFVGRQVDETIKQALNMKSCKEIKDAPKESDECSQHDCSAKEEEILVKQMLMNSFSKE